MLGRLGPGRRAKHLQVQTLWIQQLVKEELITIYKIDTHENSADALTKHVPRGILDHCMALLNITFPVEESIKSSSYEQIIDNNERQRIKTMSDTDESSKGFEDDADDHAWVSESSEFGDKSSALVALLLRRGVKS